MHISSEKAFDMLPHVVDIYDKLNLKDYVKSNKVNTEGKSKDEVIELQRDMGEEVIKFVVKNSGKIKEEFFSIIAIAEGISVEEAKQQSPVKTALTFMNVFKDKELTDFFKQAMQ